MQWFESNKDKTSLVNFLSSNSKAWLLTIGFAFLSVSVFVQTRRRERVEQQSKLIETAGDGQTSRTFEEVGASIPGRFQIVRIHDGDTCEMIGADGIQISVRFAGIDAPELAQEFGHEARQMLVELIDKRVVTLREVKREKYGRYLAQVYCESIWVNREMLFRGGAWSYLSGIHFDEFKKAEVEAKTKILGLWALKNPKPPWEARK